MNNRAIVVFNSAVAEKSKDEDSVTDIILKLEKDDVEGGGGDSDEEGIESNDHEEGMYCAPYTVKFSLIRSVRE